MKKRIIAFLLAAVLLLGLMPTALAAGGVPQVHSSEGEITVKFDSNGGSTVPNKTFASAEALLAATLSTTYWYPKVFEGWYLKDETKPDNFGKALSEAAAADFEGKTEVTLIAKWRNRQYVIKFQPNGGTGTMADQRADFDADVKLNECTFVKEGFECAGWATYFGASKPTYTDTINREWDDGDEYLEEEGSEDGEEVELYAIWQKQRSEEEKEAEAKLNAAITALAGRYFPVCGTDTNVLEMLKKVLTDKGCDANITLSMKEAVSMNDAGIDANGQIQYKYNAEAPLYMGNTAYIWPAIVLTLDGVSRVTTSSQFQIGLDSVKLEKDLTAIMDRIEIPSVVEKPEDLTQLFQYAPKAGVDPSKIDYNSNTQFITWATLTWGTDEKDGAHSIGIGEAGSGYTPYPVTVTLPQTEKTVKLTGKIKVNSSDQKIEVSKEFTVTVKAAQAAPVDYTKLLNAALTAQNALRDASTGETVSKDAVAGDVFLPDAQLYPQEFERPCRGVSGF